MNGFSLRQLILAEKAAPLALSWKQLSVLESTLSSEDQMADILSVIESTEEHPEAGPYIQKIQEDYRDVFLRSHWQMMWTAETEDHLM